MKKIVTVIGARPQFIKCAAVSDVIRKTVKETIIHTGQHYDDNMSDVFFRQLKIPEPDYNLGIGSGSHAVQVAKMITGIETILTDIRPDAVLVYGDTNSTFAGAFIAARLLIPVIHIEAGLRSNNFSMPEEQNRVLTDHISSLLFCPTGISVKNLLKEGVNRNVYQVGDVMYDSIIRNVSMAEEISPIMSKYGLCRKGFLLATIHRAENTDSRENLSQIIASLSEADCKVVLPVHPRTRAAMGKHDIHVGENILLLDPISYFDMIVLEKNAKKILTDSGGVQKEAYFLNTPCIILREETEWIELVENGAAVIVGADRQRILNAISNDNMEMGGEITGLYGDGNSAGKIHDIIEKFLYQSGDGLL